MKEADALTSTSLRIILYKHGFSTTLFDSIITLAITSSKCKVTPSKSSWLKSITLKGYDYDFKSYR